MKNQITIFNHPTFGELRTIKDENNLLWFVGKDVAEALGYTNPQKAIRDHVDEEDKTVNESFTVNGTRATLISESGLYALILSSKLPQAKVFKHWVTAEVLPSIRKDGGYMMTRADETPEEIMARAFIIAKQKIARLEEEREVLAMKAHHLDNIVLCNKCYTTTFIAKESDMTVHELFAKLVMMHIVYKQSGVYMLYKPYAALGFARYRTADIVHTDGSISQSLPNLVWTERGRVFVHALLKYEPKHVPPKLAESMSQPTIF